MMCFYSIFQFWGGGQFFFKVMFHSCIDPLLRVNKEGLLRLVLKCAIMNRQHAITVTVPLWKFAAGIYMHIVRAVHELVDRDPRSYQRTMRVGMYVNVGIDRHKNRF